MHHDLENQRWNQELPNNGATSSYERAKMWLKGYYTWKKSP